MSPVLDPLRDETTRRALVEVALVGIPAGALGCWIVHLRMSYAAESLAHGLLPGLVIAALAGVPLLIGAAGGIAVASLAVALAGRIPGIGTDTAVAVVVSTLLGLGALLALSAESPPGLGDLLFGDVLATGDGELAAAAVAAVVVTGALALLHHGLLAVSFDRVAAPALGLAPARADAVLAVLLAVALVVAVQGLGSLLVVALLVAPAAAARRACSRMAPMMALAGAVAVGAGAAGLYVSFHARTAAGASVAAALVAAWALAEGLSRLGSRRTSRAGRSRAGRRRSPRVRPAG